MKPQSIPWVIEKVRGMRIIVKIRAGVERIVGFGTASVFQTASLPGIHHHDVGHCEEGGDTGDCFGA
jgi:hypothetical protein